MLVIMSNNSSVHEKSDVINTVIQYPSDINPAVRLLDHILVFDSFFFPEALYGFTNLLLQCEKFPLFLPQILILSYPSLYKLISKIYKDLKHFNSKKITHWNNGQMIWIDTFKRRHSNICQILKRISHIPKIIKCKSTKVNYHLILESLTIKNADITINSLNFYFH